MKFQEKNPTYEEVKQSLFATTVYNRGQNVVQQLEQLHNATGKPVYFGGFNVPARELGLQNPWNPDVSNVFSKDVQLNGWSAYRDVLEPKPYFKGFQFGLLALMIVHMRIKYIVKKQRQLLTGGTENKFYKIGKF